MNGSGLPFQLSGGAIHIPAAGLWLDAHRPITGPERVFVSHAHSDHTAAHREVILTAPTAHLLRSRLGRARPIEHLLPVGERREFTWQGRSHFITLRSAGHILGSAMALVEWDGWRLLYTGDFQIRPSRAAERCDLAGVGPVDLLIMETTFGRPLYRFPPAETVLQDLVGFCRTTLAAGDIPVLVGYSLGKSQELLHGLTDAGVAIMVHETVERLTLIYEQFGWRFPARERLDPERADGKVLICPPGVLRSEPLRGLKRIRTALATGWAMEPSCRFRSQVDAAFPLSDHADYDDLIAFVQRIQPRQVFTVHGFAVDFAETLRWLGYDARALGWHEQLALPL